MIPTLVIGNKNYSSWSLRPWLALRHAGIAFDERVVRLDQEGYGEGRIAELTALSPVGKVPVLLLDGQAIWDSLAICEWAAEREARLWPQAERERARARSLVAEMHSGFASVRRELSMNIRRRCVAHGLSADTHREIARLQDIFESASGPYLFGEPTIADAFFTPVATRFRTYGIRLSPVAAEYADTLLCDAHFLLWESACIPDSWDIAGFSVIDGLYPGSDVAQS